MPKAAPVLIHSLGNPIFKVLHSDMPMLHKCARYQGLLRVQWCLISVSIFATIAPSCKSSPLVRLHKSKCNTKCIGNTKCSASQFKEASRNVTILLQVSKKLIFVKNSWWQCRILFFLFCFLLVCFDNAIFYFHFLWKVLGVKGWK